MYIHRHVYVGKSVKDKTNMRSVSSVFLFLLTSLIPSLTMGNPKSNEPLALLWAYELNRENKQLFQGLKKVNRHLDVSHPTTSAGRVNNSHHSNGKMNQQPKTQGC